MKIGKTILAIRAEREIKQFELAKQVGISPEYLSEIEKDKKQPRLDLLERICNALEIPIHVFMFKAINEEDINDPSKKRLIREIKPLISRIAENLYSESEIMQSHLVDELN
jgi:transcriptional regulator with XRE-family HTH domain